jgi:tetratricopeptide (TPR) repeat protein
VIKIAKFGQMKWFCVFIFLIFIGCYSTVYAQGNDLQLAQQYTLNGEPLKALDIYQKLYKQDNEGYYPYYEKCLITLKKFDDAESITKKMIHKYNGDNQYVIMLGDVYTQSGDIAKANALYDELLKKLPADQNAITSLAMQFYQSSNIDYAIKTIEQGRKVLGDNSVFAFSLIPLYRYKGDKEALVNEYLNILQGTPAYITSAENTMSAMFENDTDYNVLKSALLKRIQKQPEVTVYIDLLIWQYLQQKDFDQALNQSIALNRRNNDDGTSIFELCHTLIGNNAFDAAIRGYDYLIAKGKDNQYYVPAKIELINAKEQKITSGKYTQADLLDLEKDYTDLLAEFGNGSNTAFAAQRLARLQAFKLHKFADAQKLLEDIINIPGLDTELLASCKLDLGDVYLITGKQWDATLLYSQVEKDFPNTDIGEDAKFRNAKLSYYTGDFEFAKLQLDVLKAATTQLIANDALNLSLLISDNLHADSAGNALKIYARADLLIFAEEPKKAIQTLDSIDKKFPGNAMSNDILMAKARILIQQKNYNDAVPLLKKIVDDSPTNLWADDAVFMLGDIYDNQLNNKIQAKAYYQKIITDYPGSLWINEARKRFRIIRGDQPTS